MAFAAHPGYLSPGGVPVAGRPDCGGYQDSRCSPFKGGAQVAHAPSVSTCSTVVSLVVHRWLVVVLDFKTHAGQVAVQKIKVGSAGFFPHRGRPAGSMVCGAVII